LTGKPPDGRLRSFERGRKQFEALVLGKTMDSKRVGELVYNYNRELLNRNYKINIRGPIPIRRQLIETMT
jgi:hypothetical protein